MNSTPNILVQTESTQMMKELDITQNRVSTDRDKAAKNSSMVNVRDRLPLRSRSSNDKKLNASGAWVHLNTSAQTTWGHNTLVTTSAAGSFQGDYKVWPDFRESNWCPKSQVNFFDKSIFLGFPAVRAKNSSRISANINRYFFT